jgi:propane 2-monooxygenase small subunit
MDLKGWDDELGKKAWLEDEIWQGTRECVETIMGATDYLEQYFATNLVFEPLVGELFRSGFLMQAASANNDFVTPSVIAAAEGDYERNLANTIDLIYLLATDEKHGAKNCELFQQWIMKHAKLADKAAKQLQPIWSQAHSKPVSFEEARSVSEERFRKILSELNLSR